jgi:cold shock CspA family protein
VNGVIKKYFEDKGFGFIKSEKGEDYFFHVSQFQDNENPSIGASVYFDENQNEKGKCANNIKVNHKIKFIKIGEKRIRASNIKQYEKKRMVDFNARTLPGVVWDLASSVLTAENKVLHHKYELHIRTYQGETLVFRGDEIEIDSLIKEIDGVV